MSCPLAAAVKAVSLLSTLVKLEEVCNVVV